MSSDEFYQILGSRSKFQNLETLLVKANEWGDTPPYIVYLNQDHAITELVHPGAPLVCQVQLPYPTYSVSANASSVGVVVFKSSGENELFEVLCPGSWVPAVGNYETPTLNGVEGPLMFPVDMGEDQLRIFFWVTHGRHIWFRELGEAVPLPTNLGAGAELYNELLDGFRSFVSSDGSVQITENANDIDLQSAFIKTGPNDGTGLISSAIRSNFDMSGDPLLPNTLSGTTRSTALLATRETTMTNYQNTFVGASLNFEGFDATNEDNGRVVGAVASVNCWTETAPGNDMSVVFLAASDGSRIVPTAGRVNECGMIGCWNGQIYGGRRQLIAASTEGIISAPGGFHNVVLGGEVSSITAGSHSTVIGGNATTNQSNTFTLNCGNSALTNTTANSLLARVSGGATIFSSNGGASGVVLAANSSSWAAVSDIDKKENLVLVDGSDVLIKLGQLPVYSYNYIGVPEDYRCIGPCAQDWHPLFPLGGSKNPLIIETNDLVGVLLAGTKALAGSVTALEGAVAQLGVRLDALEAAAVAQLQSLP